VQEDGRLWRNADCEAIAGAGYPVFHQTVTTAVQRKVLGRNAMMKNSSMILSIVGASALAVFSMTAPVEAKKVGEWTCYDFIRASGAQQSRVVYFFKGISLADKKDTLDLSAKSFNVPISKVVQHCQKNRTEPLWDAIASYYNWP
jgi:HdeA/HdeB family